MSKYYYLVAGLPELTLEDSKLSYTVADFKTELYPALSEDDKKLIDLFYLKFDNANVLKLLKDKDAAIDPRGNYSSEELVEYISHILLPFFETENANIVVYYFDENSRFSLEKNLLKILGQDTFCKYLIAQNPKIRFEKM